MPERVPVERKQVERAAVRNHKIRTDTGIEISFPAEMVRTLSTSSLSTSPTASSPSSSKHRKY
ncbi:MAG: hypothetical protein ACLS3M_03440 [Collinsella sp.]